MRQFVRQTWCDFSGHHRWSLHPPVQNAFLLYFWLRCNCSVCTLLIPCFPHKLVFFFQMCMHAWSDRACICVNIRTFITLCVRRVSECLRKSERKSAFLFFFLQLHDIISHVSSEFILWVQSKTEKVSHFSISRFVTTAPGRLTDWPTETETDS